MRWKLRRSRIASSPDDHSAAATFLATLRSHQPRLPPPSMSSERSGPLVANPLPQRRRDVRVAADEVAPPRVVAEVAGA